ncbi:conserved Plasmodium protein, unknown function [Plasmodium malariae]|uniref:RNA-binding protein n=1 Tax=Plasmodium malariae TaxID=5858 RepID=A0A1C3KLQ4_PLAMA|nr:conserved Plasmodium protein, unknown function [Plasmodium malariae]
MFVFVFLLFVGLYPNVNAYKSPFFKNSNYISSYLLLHNGAKMPCRIKRKCIHKGLCFLSKSLFRSKIRDCTTRLYVLNKGEEENLFFSSDNLHERNKERGVKKEQVGKRMVKEPNVNKLRKEYDSNDLDYLDDTEKKPNNRSKSERNNNIKDTLKKTRKFCNYLTSKLGRLNKKLREIKKLETIFYANPNILTENQQVKLSKKRQIKNEIVLINRYRKKYISYKRNLMKNVDDLSPFFYSKKKKRKKELCSPQEFREIRTQKETKRYKNSCGALTLKSDNPKAAVQRIKSIDFEKVPKNVTDYLVYNKIGSKEEIKILFGLRAIKVNGNTIDDENYVLNVMEDEVKVFNEVINIHEDHYVIRKRFTRDQKRILNEKKNESISDVKREIKEFEKFFNIKQ